MVEDFKVSGEPFVVVGGGTYRVFGDGDGVFSMDFRDIRGELAEFSKVSTKILNRLILAGLADLCKKTWVYTEILTTLTTAGAYKYTLGTASNTMPCGLSAARKATVQTPQPSISASATGGTLGASTYSYKVTAIKEAYGETMPCSAVTQITTGSTSTVTLTWAAIGNASGYRIYGRMGSDWKLLKETTSLTWIDDGSASQGSDIPPSESFLMREIDISNPVDQNRMNSAWRTYESDNLNAIIYDGYITLELDKVPVTNGIGLQIKVAVFPTAEIAIPGVLIPHKDDIVNYVKWHLYEYPVTKTQPWGDYQKAMTYRRQYFMARDNLKERVMGSFGGQNRAQQQFFC